MSPKGAPSQSPTLSRDRGTTLGWRANTTATPTGLRLHSRTCRSLFIIWFRPQEGRWDATPLGLTSPSYSSTQGRRFAPTLGSVSERRWRSELSKPHKMSKPQRPAGSPAASLREAEAAEPWPQKLRCAHSPTIQHGTHGAIEGFRVRLGWRRTARRALQLAFERSRLKP